MVGNVNIFSPVNAMEIFRIGMEAVMIMSIFGVAAEFHVTLMGLNVVKALEYSIVEFSQFEQGRLEIVHDIVYGTPFTSASFGRLHRTDFESSMLIRNVGSVATY